MNANRVPLESSIRGFLTSLAIALILIMSALPMLSAQGTQPNDDSEARTAAPGNKVSSKAPSAATLPSLDSRVLGEIRCEIEARGRQGHLVTLTTRKASGLSVLSVLAGKTGYEIRFDSAELTDRIDREQLDISLARKPLSEVLDLIGGALGAFAEVPRGKTLIRVRAIPSEDTPERGPFLRERAISSVVEAFGTDAATERELHLQTAELQIAGGEFAAAVESYKAFFAFGNPVKEGAAARHPRSVESCLHAGRAAIEARLADDAWKFYDFFVRNFGSDSRISEAQLIGAESRIVAKSWAEAVRILRSLEREGSKRLIDERIAILSEILLAETYWELEDYDHALRLLDAGKDRHTGTHADLLGQMPLYAGLCRRAIGEKKKAIYDFRVASLSCPSEELRRRAIEEQAATHLELDEHFEALATLRIGLKLSPEPAEEFRFLRMEAAAKKGLGLTERALETLQDLSERFDDLLKTSEERRAGAITLMQDIAEIRFERREFAEAQEYFGGLERDPALRRHARLMRAKSYFEAERWRETVLTLEGLGALGDEPELELEVRRLKGDAYMKLGLYEEAIASYRDE